MEKKQETSRRGFLRASAVVGAALGAPALARGQGAASDKIVLGLIGCGGRGSYLLREALANPNVACAALCDVYEPRLAGPQRTAGGKADILADHRKLLERKDINAVIIATPDHWHKQMLIDAVAAGKDVYVEKPFCQTLEQGRQMVKAVRATRQVVQVGTHRRSGKVYYEAGKHLEKGLIGKVVFGRCYDCRNWSQGDPFLRRELDKSKLDWKRFCGPAPVRPVTKSRYFAWRWYWDYAGGLVTDVGVHVMDVMHLITGRPHPKSVVCHGGNYVLPNWETPDVANAVLDYGTHSVNMCFNFGNGQQGAGLTIYGTHGTLEVRGGSLTIVRDGPGRFKQVRLPGMREAPAHVKNFLDCVRSREQPRAPAELGYRSLVPSLLANIAYREKRMVRWDHEKEKAT